MDKNCQEIDLYTVGRSAGRSDWGFIVAVEVTGLSFLFSLFTNVSPSAFSTVAKFHEKMLKDTLLRAQDLSAVWKWSLPCPTQESARPSTDKTRYCLCCKHLRSGTVTTDGSLGGTGGSRPTLISHLYQRLISLFSEKL